MSRTVSAESLFGQLNRKREISPLAGKLAPKEILVDVANLEREYFERPTQRAEVTMASFHPVTQLGDMFRSALVPRTSLAGC